MRSYFLTQPDTAVRRSIKASQEIRAYRGWYIFEGLLFIAIGFAAMLMPGAAALTTEVLIGALLVTGGMVRFVNGLCFPHNRWRRIISGMTLSLAGGAMLFWPEADLEALIWFFGALLLLEGAMEIAMAIGYHPARRWGWVFLSGVVALLLGGFILTEGPTTGIIFLAFMLGLSLTFYGISLTTVALTAE